MKVVKYVKLLGIALFLTLGINITPVHAQSADSHLYAPYVNFINYSYQGTGNEFAPMDVQLQYGPNRDGIYQFSVDNGGTTIVYVYQLSSRGVVELAYFPETYTAEDLRNHGDVLDSFTSLILPKQLTVGATYSSGYRNQFQHEITEFYHRLVLGDSLYYDVFVIERTDSEGNVQEYYYALGAGLIFDRWQSGESPTFEVTRTLSDFNGISSYLINQLSPAE